MYQKLMKVISTLAMVCILASGLSMPALAQNDTYDGHISFDDYVLANPEQFNTTKKSVKKSTDDFQTVTLESGEKAQTAPSNRRSMLSAAPAINRYSVLLLDVSGSMYGTPIAKLKEAAIRFCEQVLQAEGNNYIAVIPFTSTSYVKCNFTDNLDTLKAAINSLNASGSTSQYAGLSRADELFSGVTDQNAIRNILLLSDGLPEGGLWTGTGQYSSSDYSYGYGYANSAYNKAVEMKPNYKIYTLAFFHSMDNSILSFGRRFMNDLQNAGYYQVIDPSELEFEFGQIANQIISKSGLFKYAGEFNSYDDAQAMYYYSDNYFANDSRVYNPQLSTMSLCLELSSFSSHETNVWREKLKNVKELLTGDSGIGFSANDFEANEYWLNAPTLKSIGVVAAKKQLGNTTLIALVVRGGRYESEWGSNFEIGESGQHSGFAKAKEEVLRFLSNYISGKGITGDIKLWLVGYSRGGAVANMVAGELNTTYILPYGVTLANSDLFCYTFEAPQGALVSNIQYGNQRNIHNIINLNDLVPLVAPSDWKFARYNKSYDYLLPNIGSKDFDESIKAMKEQYDLILQGTRVEKEKEKNLPYQILEYTHTFDVKVNIWKFLPGGDPFIEIVKLDDTSMTQAQMLVDVISAFTRSLGSRRNYYDKIEYDLKTLIGAIMGTDGDEKIARFTEKLTSELTDNYYSGTIYVISPLFNPFRTKVDQFSTSIKRLEDIILRSAKYAGLKDPVKCAKTLAIALGDTIVNNTQLIIKAIDNATSGNLFQPHYPEITMAWLRSQDSNYTSGPIVGKGPGMTRIIRINCPVNITVYNSQGRIVASIIDNIVQISNPYFGCGINENGEKILHLPVDEDFTINIQPTENGTMTFSINEYNFLAGLFSRLQNYTNITITNGELLRGIIPSITENERNDYGLSGSSTAYRLLNSRGQEITPSNNLLGSDITYYNVAVNADNESGLVVGGGEFISGSFAQVEAYPVSGGEFLGWFINGNLMSNEAVYRFAVSADTVITGKFKPVPKHSLAFASTEGGSVANINGTYTKGTEIILSAQPDPGYLFSRWLTSNGGTFINAESKDTTFSMPDNDVTVTAVFNPSTPPPKTGDETPIMLYLILSGLAGVSLLLVVKTLSKSNRKNHLMMK